MNELEKIRLEIDALDKEIVKNIEKRMELVLKVSRYKNNNNLEIEDKNRENKIFDSIKKSVKNKDYHKYFINIFKCILKNSKEIQKELNNKSS